MEAFDFRHTQIKSLSLSNSLQGNWVKFLNSLFFSPSLCVCVITLLPVSQAADVGGREVLKHPFPHCTLF